jgi:hypothetical protein
MLETTVKQLSSKAVMIFYWEKGKYYCVEEGSAVGRLSGIHHVPVVRWSLNTKIFFLINS